MDAVQATPDDRGARRAELVARLHAGGADAWLTVDDVATVLRIDPSAATAMVRKGTLSYLEANTDRPRLCNPEDVLQELGKLS